MKKGNTEETQTIQTTYTNSNNGGLMEWLKGNAWNLIITGWMIGAAMLFLQFRVASIEKAQAQFEKNLEAYPSVDYFNEKFKVIDDADIRQTKALDDVNLKLAKHFEQYQEFIINQNKK